MTGRPSLSTLSPSEFVPQSPHVQVDAHDLVGGIGLGLGLDGLGLAGAQTEQDVEEQDTFELARSYFEAKELDRCAWTLRTSRTSRAGFLRLYATYLVSRQDLRTLLKRAGPLTHDQLCEWVSECG